MLLIIINFTYKSYILEKYYQFKNFYDYESKMKQQIELLWEKRQDLVKGSDEFITAKALVSCVIDDLDAGKIRVCQEENRIWKTNEWVKKAILLFFQTHDSEVITSEYSKWIDKVPLKFTEKTEDQILMNSGIRIVPGSYIRKGAFIGNRAIVMPSFINIGAFIGEGSMIDTWATIGSCAQIGKNCHISGGVGIGGVLEPLQANPVIIEDDCFIGARSEIAEGVIVRKGSVLSMGVYIGASTRIFNRSTGLMSYGEIPEYSVVVPGSLPCSQGSGANLYCAVIVKQVEASTRAKTSINELLRG